MEYQEEIQRLMTEVARLKKGIIGGIVLIGTKFKNSSERETIENYFEIILKPPKAPINP